MKKHLYIILLILPLIGFGQGWEQTYGSSSPDVGYSVQQTVDGGYIVCGFFTEPQTSFLPNYPDIYLIKTNENGLTQWTKTFGSFSNSDYGYSVQQTTDGGYILTGQSQTLGDADYGDLELIKTDPQGNEEWSQTFNGDNDGFNINIDCGYSVQQTTDGGYVVTGLMNFGNNESVWFIKTDSEGNEVWSELINGGNGGVYGGGGQSVEQTIDGGYIIIGEVQLIKTYENGTIEWINESIGGNDGGQTSDGGYIIVGEDQLIKTDENGEEEWSLNLGSPIGDGGGRSVQQTIDGGYVICGTSSLNNIFLLKVDGNGNMDWVNSNYGGVEDDEGHSVQQTIDGGYIICGSKQSSWSSTSRDVYLIKTDPQGNVTSTIELPTPTSKRELVKTTNIIGQENRTIKNQPLIEIYDDGSTEKKIVIE